LFIIYKKKSIRSRKSEEKIKGHSVRTKNKYDFFRLLFIKEQSIRTRKLEEQIKEQSVRTKMFSSPKLYNK